MENFQWTTELVNEYIQKFGVDPSHPYQIQQLQDFKKSKEKDIPKQDWEILSFISTLGFIAEKNTDGLFKYHTHGGWTLDVMLDDRRSQMNIHSVKRLSDGVVFTVGDIVFSYSKITEFQITEKGDLWVIVKCGDSYGYPFSSLKKVKPKVPLFTTEDGGKIFEGDRVWWVNLVPLIEAESYQIDSYDFEKHCGMDDLCNYPDKYKYFSTEQKAKDWVILNKPIEVSFKQLSEYLKSVFKEQYTESKIIKEFFKSKIKL